MTVLREGGVPVVHWNPRSSLVDLFLIRKIRVRERINNFGDVLGPHVVAAVRAALQLPDRADTTRNRLVSIGSIMHLARHNDVVWGTGCNAKKPRPIRAKQLDVRSVRGPLTRTMLQQHGVACPEVFGDPGLLVRFVHPATPLPSGTERVAVSVVPNFHDHHMAVQAQELGLPVVNPKAPLAQIVDQIRRSDLVVGSSLHGLIVAEAYGVGARWVQSGTEPEFKYQDYYQGTDRHGVVAAPHLAAALSDGPTTAPALAEIETALLQTFPTDLWK